MVNQGGVSQTGVRRPWILIYILIQYLLRIRYFLSQERIIKKITTENVNWSVMNIMIIYKANYKIFFFRSLSQCIMMKIMIIVISRTTVKKLVNQTIGTV